MNDDDILRVAKLAIDDGEPWEHVYTSIFGVNGLLARYAPHRRLAWIQSDACRGLLVRLAGMRSRFGGSVPQYSVPIRLPEAVHDALKLEAGLSLTSLQQLGLSKLLIPVSPVLVGGKYWPQFVRLGAVPDRWRKTRKTREKRPAPEA